MTSCSDLLFVIQLNAIFSMRRVSLRICHRENSNSQRLFRASVFAARVEPLSHLVLLEFHISEQHLFFVISEKDYMTCLTYQSLVGCESQCHKHLVQSCLSQRCPCC